MSARSRADRFRTPWGIAHTFSCGVCGVFLTNIRRPRKRTRSLLSSLFRSSLITETDYNSVADRFGDIGSRSGYNRYMGNPSLFTQLEIESTTNFIQSLINPKDDQGDDAE